MNITINASDVISIYCPVTYGPVWQPVVMVVGGFIIGILVMGYFLGVE